MALDPRKYRELVVQVLYSLEVGNDDDEQLMKMLMEKFKVSKKNVKDALIEGKEIFTAKDSLDEEIRKRAKDFDFERIYLVERSILRLALYRLQEGKGATEKIEIAEALRLAKKFASPSAASFIHAMLDQT